jgi:hypothetical protein
MKNHKWRDNKNAYYKKKQTCIKCGVERYWRGRDWQCWEYMDLRLPIDYNRTTLHRPSCTPNLPKGITHLTSKGEYI